ncbi:head-tail adaptor protein [Marinilactibacillus psychrotolerans]|uniref:head-tail adaptor protein n=1 Tax=Marinilactibacillus psychrotolerans TaxID=191770 RepID=UPI003883A034
MNSFVIQHKAQVDDGIGGFKEGWTTFKEVEGYIDLVTGTDLSTAQNAFAEQSTHMLVIPSYTVGITDDMRVIDESGRAYSITYPDDPMGVGHHNEVYCKFSEVIDSA